MKYEVNGKRFKNLERARIEAMKGCPYGHTSMDEVKDGFVITVTSFGMIIFQKAIRKVV